MDARLLGSGGWMPTDARECCCLFVRKDDRALVIDAGTGLRRLVTDPALLDGVSRVDIALTHFHLDHVYGLAFLPAIEPPVHVWAAGHALAERPADEIVHRLLDPPFLLPEPEGIWELVAEVHELELPQAEIGPFRIDLRIQPRHTNPTLAYRIDGKLVYCTDTAYDEDNAAFARGAAVLFHEAFHPGESTEDPTHTAAGEAARIAAAAGVEHLVLIHISPRGVDEEELLRVARTRFPATELGRDGLVVGA